MTNGKLSLIGKLQNMNVMTTENVVAIVCVSG